MVMRQGARGGEAFGERRQAAGVLERVARRHKPPDAVELEPLHGEQRRVEMRLMRRIESAAEQADAHAGGVRRDDPLIVGKLLAGNLRGDHGLV